MHNQDWIEELRRDIQPGLHAILSKIGLYAMGRSGSKRYACTVPMAEEQFEKAIERMGFVRNPLAALKYRYLLSGTQISTGSWFYFTLEDPIYIYGFPLPKYQYHLTIYENPNRRAVDLYIHKELWWGTDPGGHYGGEFVKPVPDWLRERLNEQGIEYEVEPFYTNTLDRSSN